QYGGQFSGRETQPTSTVGSHGWDYKDFKNDPNAGDVFYRFEVAPDMVAEELSIILSWNAEVIDVGPGVRFDPQESLQDLNLYIYDSSDAFLGSLIESSVSEVDNVEHIYIADDPTTQAFEGLMPGTYTLRVAGAAGWDYGLAWRTANHYYDFDNNAFAFDADFDENNVVDGQDFMIWQRNNGTHLGAENWKGDDDGDCDVDRFDLVAFEAEYGALRTASLLAASVIPEPAGWGLAILAAPAWWVLRRRLTLRRSVIRQ
ncbi:MAG: hypothetical protein AAF961_17660, partial [Planctomycetota bacterium]